MTQLHIPDMSCSHCVARITQAVNAEDESASLSFDLEKKQADIASRLNASQLVKLLDDAGYEATVLHD